MRSYHKPDNVQGNHYSKLQNIASHHLIAPALAITTMTPVSATKAHAGQVRHRAQAVDYRLEQPLAKLWERLAAPNALPFGTPFATPRPATPPYRPRPSAPTPPAQPPASIPPPQP